MSQANKRLSAIEDQLVGSAPAYNPMPSTVPPRPAFSALPLDKNGPGHNCWGLFGKDDELGQLNYITPEVTKEAIKEVSSGIKIGLDLPVDYFDPPSFHRMAPKHEVKQLGEAAAHDDLIHLNTQSSTQWDGFRHVGYQKERLFYNGTTAETIRNSNHIGTNAWAKAGGFATRGVLLDYRRWVEQKGLKKSPFERTPITTAELKEIAKAQGVTFRTGDVLMVRTGYLKEYPSLDKVTRVERHNSSGPPTIGLEQSEEMVKFIWESGIVAAAGDQPALEAFPWESSGGKFVLHEWFLAGWGLPIGEYFDLERLSEECAKANKWTFFFTSIPLNVPGGVGTPPNAIAIL